MRIIMRTKNDKYEDRPKTQACADLNFGGVVEGAYNNVEHFKKNWILFKQ